MYLVSSTVDSAGRAPSRSSLTNFGVSLFGCCYTHVRFLVARSPDGQGTVDNG